MGHQWQYTQMRKVHLLGFAFPECTSSSRGSSPGDSALMCMHLCHIIQLVLQLTPTWHLNSLTNRVVMPWWHNCCSNWILYAALIQTRPQTCRLLGEADCCVTQCCFTASTHKGLPGFCLLAELTQGYSAPTEYSSYNNSIYLFLWHIFCLFRLIGTIIFKIPAVQGFCLTTL